MGAVRPMTLAAIVREHNRLNGFGLVIVEFILVLFAALFISASGVIHGRGLIAMAGAGVAVNAIAIIAMSAFQIHSHERSEGILKLRSSEFRAKLQRENPRLNTHTFIVLFTALFPFLLVAVLLLEASTRKISVR
jgi:hypothetical protein